MRTQRRLIVIALAALAGIVGAYSAFTATKSNAGNSIGASTDWTAPTVNQATIQRTGTPVGGAGYIKQNQAYYVYADVSDTGNPASGVSAVSANVAVASNVISAAKTNVTMCSNGGPFTVNGQSYNYRSDDDGVCGGTATTLTSDNSLSQITRSFSITSTDAASNSATNSSFSVIVDNTAPTISRTAFERTTGGGTGYIKAGQSYYVYAEASDASSGISRVQSNVCNVTLTSCGSINLTSAGGPWMVNGQSYNYRSSASMDADSGLSEGSKSTSITVEDNLLTTNTASNNVVVDNTGPTFTRATILRGDDVDKGSSYLKADQTYRVYAEVADAASGVDTTSVTANVTTITSGLTSAALTYSAGGYTVGGNTYHYRSAVLNPSSGLPSASNPYSYTIGANDNVTNNATSSNYTLTGDNTGPTFTRATILRGDDVDKGSSYLKADQTYRVYAEVADAASGVDTTSVTANVTTITSGLTSAALTYSAGGYTVGGNTYHYRSAVLNPSSGLPSASNPYSYTIGANDNVTNNATSSNYTLTGDNTAPTVSSTTIAKTPGYFAGKIHQGGNYFVYANVSDAASGVSTVTADICNISGNSCPDNVTLNSGSYSAEGTSYNYRSDQLAASGSLSAGNPTYTLTSTDNVVNSGTQSGYTVNVNNSPGTGSSFVLSNDSGGTAGKMEQGDKITLKYSKIIDPQSVLSGWDGTSQNIIAHLDNNTPTNDRLTFYDYSNPGTQIALGSIDLGGTGYTTSDITFGASGANSTMVGSGFGTWIVVTLGNPNTPATAQGTSPTGAWTPSGSSYDGGGNNYATTAVNSTIDNTPPTGSDITTPVVGTITGRPQINDSIRFTSSEQLDPASILSGFTGANMNVLVKINNAAGSCVANSDTLEVWNTTATTASTLGTVCLGGTGYVTANNTFGNATQWSVMSQSTTQITVVLGTCVATCTAATQGSSTTMKWTTLATAYDLVHNMTTVSTVSESGGADVDF